MLGWIVFGIIVYIVIALVAADTFASIAEEKGFERGKYYAMSLLLGIIGWIAVAALPDRGRTGSAPRDSRPVSADDEIPEL